MDAAQVKPFEITQRMVEEAYKLVKKRKGSAGVDEQSLEDFDKELENNLYKIWNDSRRVVIFLLPYYG